MFTKDVCFQDHDRHACCLPDIHGLNIDCLWDTGAQISLVSQEVADRLHERGAVVRDLQRNIRVNGLGNGSMVGNREIIAKVRFQDNKCRSLAAVIVPSLPYGIILGLDFMASQRIGFNPHSDGFELTDTTRVNNPVIYSTIEDRTSNVFTIQTNKRKVRKMGKKGARKYVNYLNTLPQTDRDFMDQLRSLRPNTTLTSDEVCTRLRNAGLIPDEANVFPTSTKPTELKAPKCDFPEYQDELDKLCSEFADVFSSGSSDVGKSTGKKCTIRLADNKVVNVRSYRTPIKLRPVMQKLIDDLLVAGVIE